MTLDDEIAEAQTYASEPPKNESSTCEWIIVPLLRAAGYAKREIEPRVSDSTGQFPDYTLLPNDQSASWYLEAKAWNVSLEDVHAKQALNYANHNGKRFVILTNGQQWRLYDNAIQGLLSDKLITHAPLRDTPEITRFMTTLSKTEVLAGSFQRVAVEMRERKEKEALEQHARQKNEEETKRGHQKQLELRTRLETELPVLLSDPDSELAQFITLYLNEKGEYTCLAARTLSGWFDDRFNRLHEGWEDEYPTRDPLPTVRPPLAENNSERTLNLKLLQGLPIDGKSSRPISLRTPDRKMTIVRSWVDLAEEAVRWLMLQSPVLPVPFESGNRNRWFLNHSPIHKNSRRSDKFQAISSGGATVYMDKDRTGKDLLQAIFDLCQATQIRADDFHITIVS